MLKASAVDAFALFLSLLFACFALSFFLASYSTTLVYRSARAANGSN